MRDERDFDLTRYNTFGIKTTCRRFIEFASVDELTTALATLTKYDLPLLTLGGGSNILFTKDFNGTVFHSAIRGMEHMVAGSDVFVRVGSGEVWDDFVAYAVGNGWYGAENLSLIPGSVGASAVQNIGAYGAEAKDIIYSVEAIDIAAGERVCFSNADCRYDYRHSRFKEGWRGRYIVTHVTYRLSTQFVPHLDYGNIRSELSAEGISEPTAQQLRDIIIKIRRQKLPDPEIEGNAGSFFMNPVVEKSVYESIAKEYGDVPHYLMDDGRVKIPAGWMIDRCGWKGRTVGRVGVHDKQALVLVNRGGATGTDVVSLCEAVQSDVKNSFGIEIKPEVNII